MRSSRNWDCSTGQYYYRWIPVIHIWKGEIMELWGFEVETALWFWMI